MVVREGPFRSASGLKSHACPSLPGALGMFGLSVGVSNMGDTLPGPVYAVLSGLNAATVGIIALAAVELSQKVITDRLTRLLVFFGASAGLLYNALWYFPVVLVGAGLVSVVYDFRLLHPPVLALRKLVGQSIVRTPGLEDSVELAQQTHPVSPRAEADADSTTTSNEPRVIPPGRQFGLSWKLGLAIIGCFFITFAVVMAVRSAVPSKGLIYSLFANMYLAGTIIFGGGPVVIPLLREYVVAEGWVSPRDFLIGLALIQGFPGPNFNFAVYLGALTAVHGGHSPLLGAVLAAVGIFLPGLVLVHGGMGIWGTVRAWRGVKSTVRGLNAAAVGFIYTAVYRLWQIGWIEKDFQQGTSLANDPWWVVVTATSYVGGCWFGLQPPVAMVVGAGLGLVRYGVVTA